MVICDDWMWTGNVFQTIAAATGNERRPMVVRRYDGTNSSSVDDDLRRRRPGRSDTRTSWFKYAGSMPSQDSRPMPYQRNFQVWNSAVPGDAMPRSPR